MKKLKQMLGVLVTLTFAAVFFAACGGDDETPEGQIGVTYTLSVENIAIFQGGHTHLADHYTLTASDSSSIVDIDVSFECTSCTSTCEITIEGDNIQVPNDAGLITHTFLATAKKDDKTVATKSFTVTVKDASSIEITSIAIDNMNIYRIGSPEADRTIAYALFDGTTEINVDDYLADVVVEYAVVGLTITGGIIQSNKTYEIKTYTVTATVKKAGVVVADVNKQFTVTVSKLEFSVKFFNGAAELTDLAKTVEYGDTITAPDAPVLDGLNFGGWYTSNTFNEVFNFSNPITEATDIFGEYAQTITHYNLAVTITIDAEAPISDDEFVWIAGNFYNQSSPDWETFLLAEIEAGIWTTTLPQIPIENETINYNVYAVTSNSTISWNIKASATELTLENAKGGILEYTVTQWSRPVVVAGNMLINPSFEDTGDWALSGSQWFTNWTDKQPNEQWVNKDSPSPKDGARVFVNFNFSEGATANYFTSGTPWRLYQGVSTTTNDSLVAGAQIQLDVSIQLCTDDLTNGGSDFKFLIGSSTHTVELTNTTWIWQDFSFKHTLTEEDISNNAVLVGFEYTPGSNAVNSRLAFDSWYFGAPIE